MKKVIAGLVAGLVLVSGSAFADTVFYCKSDTTMVTVVEKNNIFTFSEFKEGRTKPVLSISKPRDSLGMDINTENGRDFAVSLMFVEGDIVYQAANDKQGGKNYGSFEVLRMGTSVGFGKCEPDSYIQKLTDAKTMKDITVVD
ncbi:hypothetical protein JOAD_166 [Erwinia phage vB_EamM_Joad]|uniref:Uncharacterized protein n=1 Tax=Erwinia phage vB_EamM_Joad TaxID=2026081 RepID=A0A223LJR0_9CAUD|nr:hypothetical protein JOAD_166 [Erwinia phage vB_EamM_Joad]